MHRRMWLVRGKPGFFGFMSKPTFFARSPLPDFFACGGLSTPFINIQKVPTKDTTCTVHPRVAPGPGKPLPIRYIKTAVYKIIH